MKFAFPDAALVLWLYGTCISEQSFGEVVKMQFASFLVNALRQFLLVLCVYVFSFHK